MMKEKNGASCRVKIMPGINENGTDTESLNNIRLANNKLEDDASTDVSEISDDVNEIRRLRTVHPDDWLSDEKATKVLRNVQIVINSNRTKNKNDKANATARLRGIISDTQHSLDLAFVAGTLATTANVARSDAVQFAKKLNDEDYKKAVEDAKNWLKPTVKKISD